ncbi:AMP dependent ligase/synthetase [Entamoeba marina]
MNKNSITISDDISHNKGVKSFDDYPKTLIEALLLNQSLTLPAITLKTDRKNTTTWQNIVEASFQCAYCLLDIKHQYDNSDTKTVIICMGNCKEVFEITYGCLLSGLVPLFISPRTPINDILEIAKTSNVVCSFFDFRQKAKFENIYSEYSMHMVIVGAKISSNKLINPYLNFVSVKEETPEMKKEKEDEINYVIENTKEDSICEISYVPSEFGGLKGVIWTHNNILAQCHYLHKIFQFRPKERYLHFFSYTLFIERIFIFYLSIIHHFHIFVATPDVLKRDAYQLFELSEKVKPTILLGVPRAYEKIIEKLVVKHRIKTLGNWARHKAEKSGMVCQKQGCKSKSLKFALWIVNRKLKKIGLHKLRVVLNSITPMKQSLINELYKHGLFVNDGLCLAETTGFATINRNQHFFIEFSWYIN